MRHDTGVCAACGSENIEYGKIVDTSAEVYYPITCNDCGAKSREVYDLIHIGTFEEGEEYDSLEEPGEDDY